MMRYALEELESSYTLIPKTMLLFLVNKIGIYTDSHPT